MQEGGKQDERNDLLSPGGGGEMKVGVGVPCGGRAADTCAVKASVAQRMRVLSCMTAIRLAELTKEFGG